METFIKTTDKTKQLVDTSTGELKELTVVKKITQDDFIMVFIKAIPDIAKLEGNQIKVLMACWKESVFNPSGTLEGNIIYNNKFFKNNVRLKCQLDLSDSAIDAYISALAKNRFLIKQCKGTYMLNPEYFFKGRLTDATKLQLQLQTY